MTQDRIKGAAKDAMGTAKEKAGDATDNERLEAEGKGDKLEGKAQGAMGKAKQKAGDIKDKVT
jgi:uncharacterized protein YjbJ (UPF0337 family)